MVQKLYRRLKLTTDRQTDGQDKNNMPPIIRSRGIKIKFVFIALSATPSTCLWRRLFNLVRIGLTAEFSGSTLCKAVASRCASSGLSSCSYATHLLYNALGSLGTKSRAAMFKLWSYSAFFIPINTPSTHFSISGFKVRYMYKRLKITFALKYLSSGHICLQGVTQHLSRTIQVCKLLNVSL